MIATWFGPATLNWIVPFYTWLGVVLLLFMFARTLFGWKAIVAAALLIVFTTLELSVDVMRVEWGRTMFTSLMLFPQHFLPGMLYPLLLLTLRRNGRFLAICGLVWLPAFFGHLLLRSDCFRWCWCYSLRMATGLSCSGRTH